MKTTLINEKKSKELTVEGEDSIKLSIHADGIEHLMGTLSNLYSRPAEAVFREYVSNALDSHTLAQQTKPISVWLTRTFDEFQLTVEDFGVGMDREDIVNVYSKYAASTKRGSNAQIGAFGLGAKSALAVTSRFDVTAIKNGVEIVFYCEKKSGVGTPRIVFLSEKPTTQANGVKVTIPLSETSHAIITTFVSQGFFKTWNPELVLFNGQEITTWDNVYDSKKYKALYSGEQIIGWIKLKSEAPSHGEVYRYNRLAPAVSISGIGYQLDLNSQNINPWDDLKNNKVFGKAHEALQVLSAWGLGIVINLPIGSVDLTPSRETIMITPKTVSGLQDGFLQLMETIYSQMRSELNTKSQEEAFSFFAGNLPAFGVPQEQYQNLGNRSQKGGYLEHFDVLYKGKKIPNYIVTPTTYVHVGVGSTSWKEQPFIVNQINLFALHNKHTTDIFSHTTALHYKASYQLHNSIVVYGQYDTDNLAKVKRNIRSYSEANGGTKHVTLYFVDSVTKPESEWLGTVSPVVSVVEIERVGKEYRAKIAASRKGQGEGKKRPTAIHFGVSYDSKTKQVTRRKMSNSDLADSKKVILVSQAIHNTASSGYYSPDTAYGVASTMWAEIMGVDAWEDTHWRAGERNLISTTAKAFPDALIVFVPSSRSVNPILKANPETVFLHDAWVESVKEATKTVKEKKYFDNLASINLSLYGAHSLFTLISVQPEALEKIKNIETKETVKRVGEHHHMVNLMLTARLFFSRRGNASYRKDVDAHFTNWSGETVKNGWGEKYSYINPIVNIDTEQENALTFAKLVNVLDA